MLGLSFYSHPLISHIHLVDPSLDVVKVLKEKLLDSYITMPEKINIHHKKGQDLILSNDCKTVYIAGMGGKEIKEIIDSLDPQLNEMDRLVISPHRYILELREYLNNSSWGLRDEVLIKENQQYYQILVLEKRAALPRVHPFGQKIWKEELGQEYQSHQLKTFRHHKDALSMALVAYLEQLSC